MFAATLRHLQEAGHLSVTHLAEATNIDPSTIYKWMGDHSQPGVESFRKIIQALPPDGALELFRWLASGRPFFTEHLPAADTDEPVDADAVLDDLLQYMRFYIEFVEMFRAARKDGRIDDVELANLERNSQRIIREIRSAMRRIEQMHQRDARRVRLSERSRRIPPQSANRQTGD